VKIRESEAASPDPRRALVERVVASRGFARSPRLRALLTFTCERALVRPASPIPAREIAAAVFPGPPGRFAADENTLVRVHTSRLRRGLAEYFAGAGAGETLVIDIPRFSYTPLFRSRPVAIPAPRPRRTLAWALGFPSALAAAAISLGVAASPHAAPVEGEVGPMVERVWAQMFDRGHTVSMVLGDGDLPLLEAALGHSLTVDEYATWDFRAPVAGAPRGALDGPVASVADMRVAQRVSVIGARTGFAVQVLSAREATPLQFHQNDVIVAGSRRANPWLALVEEGLAFRSGSDPVTGRAWFDNVRPGRGEAPRYAAEADRGYCRVAYRPALGGTGSVVLLSGTEAASSEAGLDLLTREPWLAQLRSRLGAAPAGRFPYFEALVKTQIVSSSSAGFELVAWRTLAEGS
jgi:hypothetical protein